MLAKGLLIGLNQKKAGTGELGYEFPHGTMEGRILPKAQRRHIKPALHGARESALSCLEIQRRPLHR